MQKVLQLGKTLLQDRYGSQNTAASSQQSQIDRSHQIISNKFLCWNFSPLTKRATPRSQDPRSQKSDCHERSTVYGIVRCPLVLISSDSDYTVLNIWNLKFEIWNLNTDNINHEPAAPSSTCCSPLQQSVPQADGMQWKLKMTTICVDVEGFTRCQFNISTKAGALKIKCIQDMAFDTASWVRVYWYSRMRTFS